MYKLKNYRCKKCEHEVEKLHDDNDIIGLECPECDGILEEWNFKNNKQRVFIFDSQR